MAAVGLLHRLGGQHGHLRTQASVQVLPPYQGLVRLQTAVVQRVQYTFDCHITRQIPQIAVTAACFGGVAQQTVEHAVQIGAVDARAAALKLLREPCAVEVQAARVGGKGCGVKTIRYGECG